MTRAAILPYPGDPFLLNYWLYFFDNVWGQEVDQLYIIFNSPIEDSVRDYIKSLCNARDKIKMYEFRSQIEHGACIDFALDNCGQDLIMLIEDDGFIFKPGVVDEAFRMIEQGDYDIVGSKRGSCSYEILKRAQEIWKLDYEGDGDQGPNFWPNFFFCKRSLLLRTDREFGAKAWKKGEIIKWLGLEVQEDIANGDTFVNTSLQLRSMIPESRIAYLPQYHGHPDDLDHYEKKKYLFDGKAPWTHVGSLSSGVSGLLRDDRNRSLAERKVKNPEDETKLPLEYCQSEMEHKEFERRVQWWDTFIKYFFNQDPSPEAANIAEFAISYQQAVDQLIRAFGLNRKRIMKRQAIYKELMGI